MSYPRKRQRSESPDAQCSTPVHGSGEAVLDPLFHSHRSKELVSLWESRELCDVDVVVEGTRFQAHRVVLAAGSPHFRAMFTKNFSESKAREVELHEITAEGFQGVLSFLYSGEVSLRDSTAELVLLAADRCEVLGLVNLCCSFLLDRITWRNCLHYWSLAEQVVCLKLKRKARLVALKHFEVVLTLFLQELYHTGLLLDLDAAKMSRIIKSKKLRASNEQVVLEGLVTWLQHDFESRRHVAESMLRCEEKKHEEEEKKLVRLPRLAENTLRQLLNTTFLRDCSTLDVLIADVQKYQTMTEEDQRNYSEVWARKRWNECGWLYAVGGSDGLYHLDSVERYEAVEDVWYPVAPMRTARRNCGVGVLNGHLYAVGGRNENKQVMDNIERYDSKEDRWERVEHPMQTARSLEILRVPSSRGGDKRNSSLQTAECYDAESGKWSPVASMSERRYGCGAGVLDGKLYVVGGTVEKNGDYLETVERYDSETDKWESVAPMSTSRYCCGVAVMKGKLYAVGGVDKRYNKLSSVESFDPTTGAWSPEPPMLTARYNCGVEEAAGNLYVVGGRDEKNRALCTVECFDGQTHQWRTVSQMSTVRSSGAVAVLPPMR
ncbi:hypothetical protein GUITHDRAFT_138195 [Guillardia theta CCMP2712]|uniref:BTB domain-containing protein n=1 Tax=Guillardia theta (strain CCMP2712) TaxID=905079 RepID=L1JE83_GUITC|nr:hypothetical protein GUITHDRAFT_138195 [Guillardia theta CCMP2712]EKX46449.1 hypothetical protein GUITHDRAFT_138195 [Guillardia theta CCMP2712]|eukprot:XP_005833429.1 hypothetical protein GUITHDRAFT_138195 [Guillardia theta CCMP2712]